MQALLDLDVAVYKAGFRSQKVRYAANDGTGKVWLPEGTTLGDIKALWKKQLPSKTRYTKYVLPDPVNFACHTAKQIVEHILEEVGTQNYRGFLTSSDKSNFRYHVAKTKGYKAGRASKPIRYKDIRDYYVNFWNAQIIKGMEADDALGITQTKLLSDGKDSVIVSIDKDMHMIPGKHYNPDTKEWRISNDPGELSLVEIGQKTRKWKLSGCGVKWFYAQMLLGDNCDNIPGLQGCGPVAVSKALADCTTEAQMFDKVYKMYYAVIKDKAKTDEFLQEIGTLLWIRRYDRKEWR